MRPSTLALSMLLGAQLLSSCDLAPVYDQPQFLLPPSYQGTGPFRPADSEAVMAIGGEWWTLFGDPELNQFESELARADPTLQSAADVYAQARALAAEARSPLYPQVNAAGSSSENRLSPGRLGGAGPLQQASNEIATEASWEPDFWGAIRNGVRQRGRLAQASAADLAVEKLSLQAQLAIDYVAIRGLDVELDVLRQSILSYRRAVEVTRLRAQGEIASGLDLARALAQLHTAQAQETDTKLQRDVLQHAIAALVGEMPSTFSIQPRNELRLVVPEIPAGIPSQLLQRRPDIASAERQMAAANAAIGISRAAFYPNITLSGTFGLEDTAFNLLSLPNRLWSIGAGAALPLFEGGLRRAELQRSWSEYAQTRDTYRATVLAAFQEVEDGLSLTRHLREEALQQADASDEAQQALSISTALYQGGLDNYLSVSVAQVQALSARVLDVQVRVRQIQAAVTLIRALGGGWTVHDLPNERQILSGF